MVSATRDNPAKPVSIESLYPNFKGPAQGSLIKNKAYTKPHQYFEEFWSNDIIGKFVTCCTNAYAQNPLKPIRKWKILTNQELKTFFAIVGQLGLVMKYSSRDQASWDPMNGSFVAFGAMTQGVDLKIF